MSMLGKCCGKWGEGKAWSEWQVHSVGHAQPPCFCPLIFLSATPTSVISDHWCISRRTWLGFFSSGFNHQKVPCFSRSSCPERTQVASRKASGRGKRRSRTDPAEAPGYCPLGATCTASYSFLLVSFLITCCHITRVGRADPSPHPPRGCPNATECNTFRVVSCFAFHFSVPVFSVETSCSPTTGLWCISQRFAAGIFLRDLKIDNYPCFRPFSNSQSAQDWLRTSSQPTQERLTTGSDLAQETPPSGVSCTSAVRSVLPEWTNAAGNFAVNNRRVCARCILAPLAW